jgi:hypothetical protein
LKIGPDRVFKLGFELGEGLVGKLAGNRGFDEFGALSGASAFMSGELGLKVVVQKAGERGTVDRANRAKDALPLKPSFHLE